MKTVCNMCGMEKKVEVQPSRSQLMCGGFPVKYENRCSSCERKLVKQINNILEKIGEQNERT